MRFFLFPPCLLMRLAEAVEKAVQNVPSLVNKLTKIKVYSSLHLSGVTVGTVEKLPMEI
jgi:hypothetical protein